MVRSHTRARLGLPYNICTYKERGDVPGICIYIEEGGNYLVHHVDEGLVHSQIRARLELQYNICIYKERGDVPGICIYSERGGVNYLVHHVDEGLVHSQGLGR